MNALQAKRFTLEGLDCASCAARIEAAIQRETGLGEVGINFSTRSILLPPAYAAKVQEIIDRIEPGVRLVDEATAGGRSAHGRDLAHGRDHAHVYDQPYGHRHGHAHPHDHIHDGDHRHDHSHGRSHAHEHKHEHDHDHVDRPASVRRIVEIAIAASLLVAGIAFSERLNRTPFSAGEFVVLLPAYWLAGRHVVTVALRNFRRGLLFDENSLMTIATVGAILIRELPEAVGVMLFYSVGEAFQDHAVDRSRRSIKALMDIRPDFANVRRNGTTQRVDPNTVDVGEEISVRPGERIPLDGDVIEGESYVDVSALTGESVPRRVAPGDAVLAGSVNLQGLLAVRVTRPFGESSVSKILDLVENAGARKARTEKFITRFSRYYTPAVAAAALGVAVIPPLLIEGAQFGEWVYRALVLLVISCPCALVLSIPLGYFGGIGGASRHGILVKGANFLDALTQVDTLAMDKTGTLTQGAFKVRKVAARSGFADDEVLRLAAHAERHSSHPIAAAIAEAYGGDVDESRIAGYEEIAGHGVKAFVGDRLVVAGNDRLLHSESIPHDECLAGETIVNVAVDGVLAGSIVIADEIKPDAAQALRSLKGLGIRRTVMLSGDDRQVAEQVARTLGIDEVYAELLPEEKVAVLEKIAQERHAAPGRKSAEQGKIAFAGDGINDAPVLARADVGIAMGGLGSDAAIEAADIVIMDDQPSKIGKAIAIARRTRAIVLQNIALALGVKAAVIFLGTLGMASMWEAVFADVGVSLIAVLNSARALRV